MRVKKKKKNQWWEILLSITSFSCNGQNHFTSCSSSGFQSLVDLSFCLTDRKWQHPLFFAGLLTGWTKVKCWRKCFRRCAVRHAYHRSRQNLSVQQQDYYWILSQLKKKKKAMTPACHHFTQILTVSLPVLDGHERKSMHAVIFLAPFSPPSCDLAQRFEWQMSMNVIYFILHVSLWSIMYRYKSKGMNHSSAPFWTDCTWNCATVKSDRGEKSKGVSVTKCHLEMTAGHNAHFAAVMKTRRVGYLSVNY